VRRAQGAGTAAGAPDEHGRAVHPPRARNPDPGAFLPVGGYVIQGFAFDPAAVGNTEGAGISSIEVFLDDPNQGGQILGSTGMNATGEEAGSVFAMPSTRQRQATGRSDEAVPVRWACVRPGSQNWSAAETLRLRRMRTT
jgi:hypothetical protein